MLFYILYFFKQIQKAIALETFRNINRNKYGNPQNRNI